MGYEASVIAIRENLLEIFGEIDFTKTQFSEYLFARGCKYSRKGYFLGVDDIPKD